MTRRVDVEDFASRIAEHVTSRRGVKDGSVELSRLHNDAKELAREAAREADRDGDGVLTRSEYKEARHGYIKLFSRNARKGFNNGEYFVFKKNPTKRRPHNDVNKSVHDDEMTTANFDGKKIACDAVIGKGDFTIHHDTAVPGNTCVLKDGVLVAHRVQYGTLIVESGGSFLTGASASGESTHIRRLLAAYGSTVLMGGEGVLMEVETIDGKNTVGDIADFGEPMAGGSQVTMADK